tara:strand:+ start:1327 stop:1623 length:297 start_codon:yes stop_codon:yes gene_type:complete
MMSKYIMLLLAIFNTVCEMGPQYIVNFTDWIKTALWNAPFRVFLDIELELLRLNRRLDPDSESDEEIKPEPQPEPQPEPEEKSRFSYLSNLWKCKKVD